MPILERNKKVFIRADQAPATKWSDPQNEIFLTTYAGLLPRTVDVFPEPQIINRDVKHASLTPPRGISGPKIGRGRIQLELLDDNRHLWAPLLVACGCRQSQVCKIKITSAGIQNGAGSAAAILRHGTKVFFGTPSSGVLPSSSQFFTIIGDYYGTVGDTFTVFGTFAQNQGMKGTGGSTSPAAADVVADNLTVASATAKFTIATSGYVDNGGRGFYPMSFPVMALNFASGDASPATVNVGDVLQGTTSGAIAISIETKTIPTSGASTVYVRAMSGSFSTGEVVQDNTSVDANIGTLAASDFYTQDAGATTSMATYHEGVVQIAYGLRGNATFEFTSGQIPTMSFDMQGLFDDSAQNIALPTITDIALNPQIFVNTHLVIGTDGSQTEELAPCIQTLSFSTGNEISERPCSNAETGISEYAITARRLTGSMDPELHLETEWPEIFNMLNNINIRIGWRIGAFTSGNNVNANNEYLFQVPRAEITADPSGERNGFATRQMGFAANSGTSGTSTKAIDSDFVLIVDRVPGQWTM